MVCVIMKKTRHYFNALPSERDFRETYLPGFQALVEDSKVESVMCAYNRTFDKPCCGSEYLLNDILRQEWGFGGHIVSDCWALDDIKPILNLALCLYHKLGKICH